MGIQNYKKYVVCLFKNMYMNTTQHMVCLAFTVIPKKWINVTPKTAILKNPFCKS